MNRFFIHATPICGVQVIERSPLSDDRGLFERMFCVDELRELEFCVHQMNRSFTRDKGCLRGMHYQIPPHAETKIVSCLRGSVLDVAVDLRAGSSTFLQWHGEMLSAENFRSMVIPKGVAHGFQTLERDCELLYLHDAAYAPDSESEISVFEKRIGIAWPLPPSFISKRDKSASALGSGFEGIVI